MLDTLVEHLANTVKDSVMSGLKGLSDKIEPRLKALEEKEFPEFPETLTIEDVIPHIESSIKAIPEIEVLEMSAVESSAQTITEKHVATVFDLLNEELEKECCKDQ